MIIDNINWPKNEDIDEDIVSLEDHCLIMSFLRRFIESGKLFFLNTFGVSFSAMNNEVFSADVLITLTFNISVNLCTFKGPQTT